MYLCIKKIINFIYFWITFFFFFYILHIKSTKQLILSYTYPYNRFQIIKLIIINWFECILINLFFFLDTQAVPDEEPLPNTAFSPPGATFSLRHCGVLPETVYRDPLLHLLLLRGVCVCVCVCVCARLYS